MNLQVQKILSKMTIDVVKNFKRLQKIYGTEDISVDEVEKLLLEVFSTKHNETKVIHLYDTLYFRKYDIYFDEFIDKNGCNLAQIALKAGYSIPMIKHIYSAKLDANHVNNDGETIMHMAFSRKDINYSDFYRFLNGKGFDNKMVDKQNRTVADVAKEKLDSLVVNNDDVYCELIRFRSSFYNNNPDLLMTKLRDSDTYNNKILSENIFGYESHDLYNFLDNCIANHYEESLVLESLRRLFRQEGFDTTEDFGKDFVNKALKSGYSETFILFLLEELFNYGLDVNSCNSIINTAIVEKNYKGSVYNIYKLFRDKGFEPLTESFEFMHISQAMFDYQKGFTDDEKRVIFEMNKYNFIKELKKQCGENNIKFIINDINNFDEIYSVISNLKDNIIKQCSLFSRVHIDFIKLIIQQTIADYQNNINECEMELNEEMILFILKDIINGFYNECLEVINSSKVYKLKKNK